MIHGNLNRSVSIILTFVFTISALVFCAWAGAQGIQTFKVGDRVEADPMLIGQWRRATVIKVYLVDGQLNGYEVRMDREGNAPAEEYTVGKNVERGIRALKPGDEAVPERAGSTDDRTNSPANRIPNTAGGCANDPILDTRAVSNESMELGFKRALLRNYQKRVEERGLTSPLGVGLTFETFQIGPPRINRRTLDSLDGTYMRSAPVGANIYPVKTKLNLCERFRNEITRTSIDGRYECFKDTSGAWACGNASGWRTLETQRERIGER